ncbi:MAG: TIGR01212 family radical SAM protein [Desulfobacteraceae bacterium]|jgi:radical SAM protein (TIGR01212 family)
MTPKRYYDLNSYFKNHFGQRVHKISIDAGFTCPNRDGSISKKGCIYCNDRGSGTGALERGHSVGKQLEIGKIKVAKRFKAKKFLAYFQSFTNTYAPADVLKKIYAEALNVKDVIGLAIGTRPDCVNGPVLDILSDFARNYLIWLELGLQSVHDETLAFINRGHDFECFLSAVKAIHGKNIKICVHIIIGLPGEDRSKILETARTIAALGIDGIKLHLLYVIKGTYLHELYKKGAYRCLEQHEYVTLLCDFLELLPPDMVIQRLTGDPHPKELVAPLWAMDKRGTLELFHQELLKRDTYQGKNYCPVSLTFSTSTEPFSQ